MTKKTKRSKKRALCTRPPAGWSCTRAARHPGPCAAVPTPSNVTVKPHTTTTYVLALTKVETWQEGTPPSTFERKTPMGSVEVPERLVATLTAEGAQHKLNVAQLLFERGMMGDHYITGDFTPAPREGEAPKS